MKKISKNCHRAAGPWHKSLTGFRPLKALLSALEHGPKHRLELIAEMRLWPPEIIARSAFAFGSAGCSTDNPGYLLQHISYAAETRNLIIRNWKTKPSIAGGEWTACITELGMKWLTGVSVRALAGQLGCKERLIAKAIALGIIKPVKYKNSRAYIISKAEVEILKKYIGK